MSRNVLKSSVQNASFSIVFQILFRCITFILNAFIIRHVGQNVLGIMNVRLLLLESTILFLSREPLLKACLTNTKAHNWAQVINQIWLSLPLTGVLCILLVYVWINVLSGTELEYVGQYRLGCYSIALSCIIDQITQSAVLVAQSFCFVKLKVVLDTIYILCRTAIFVFLVVKSPSNAINAFSIAQLLSAIIFCVSYYAFFWWYIKELNERRAKEKKDNNCLIEEKSIFSDMNDFPFTNLFEFFPGVMDNSESAINKDLCVLAISFSKQCVIKQVLTEGERYVMTISPILTFSQQSMYDIVNNLGSLAARFIFRPIEESGYFYFTQMIKRDEDILKQDQINVQESVSVLSHLCRVVTSIGLIVVVFGQTYSETLLYLYGGAVLTSDPLPANLLKWHCVAVLLLAVNGVTECYVFATMNNKQLDRYNYIMVIFSITFLLISYVLTNIFGPVGFILANCVNMAARIVHSLYFISKKYGTTKYKPLEGLFPDKYFVTALIFSAFVTKVSEIYCYQRSIFLHVFFGGICFSITGAVWAYENQPLLRLGYDKYKRRVSLKTD